MIDWYLKKRNMTLPETPAFLILALSSGLFRDRRGWGGNYVVLRILRDDVDEVLLLEENDLGRLQAVHGALPDLLGEEAQVPEHVTALF